jgi:hypothetical protein
MQDCSSGCTNFTRQKVTLCFTVLWVVVHVSVYHAAVLSLPMTPGDATHARVNMTDVNTTDAQIGEVVCKAIVGYTGTFLGSPTSAVHCYARPTALLGAISARSALAQSKCNPTTRTCSSYSQPHHLCTHATNARSSIARQQASSICGLETLYCPAPFVIRV